MCPKLIDYNLLHVCFFVVLSFGIFLDRKTRWFTVPKVDGLPLVRLGQERLQVGLLQVPPFCIRILFATQLYFSYKKTREVPQPLHPVDDFHVSWGTWLHINQQSYFQKEGLQIGVFQIIVNSPQDVWSGWFLTSDFQMVMKQLNLYSSLEHQPGKRQRCKPTFIMLLHLCEGVRA